MKYSVVYSLGSYDHLIEENIPTLALAQAVVTGLQRYHDKPLDIKPVDEVRNANLRLTDNIVYDLVLEPTNDET